MKTMIKIQIPTRIIEDSVGLALSRPLESRGDFFHEIRKAFKEKLEDVFISNGIQIITNDTLGPTNYLKEGVFKQWRPLIKYTGWNNNIKEELDLIFCANYGHDDYSISGINYIDRTHVYLPALSSLSNEFSIGNIALLVENEDYEIELSLSNGIYATGYSYQISKRKKKSYFCLFGIWFQPELVNEIYHRLTKHDEKKEDLDEIKLDVISYPMLYINRITGNFFTCSCFNSYFNIGYDIERLLPYGNSEEGLKNRVRDIKSMNGLCHYCSGGIPKHEYGHRMYYSSFLQRYLPYHRLLSLMKHGKVIHNGEEYRNIEDELREHFGYPKVGQQWVTETTLYKIICILFSDYKVIYHYRGAELEGLELDIWLPDLKLGIEYQGEQHYKVVEHWGGKAGLEKRIANDKKKKRLCKAIGYHLVEIKYTEEITESLIKKKVEKVIGNTIL